MKPSSAPHSRASESRNTSARALIAALLSVALVKPADATKAIDPHPGKVASPESSKKSGIKSIVLSEGTPIEVQKEYQNVLNGAIGVISHMEPKLKESLDPLNIQYSVVKDARAESEQLPEALKRNRPIGKGMDSFLVVVQDNETGEVTYVVTIEAGSFEQLAELITAVDHEWFHAYLFAQGRHFDSPEEEERVVLPLGIASLKNIRHGLSSGYGTDNKTVRGLGPVIEREEATLDSLMRPRFVVTEVPMGPDKGVHYNFYIAAFSKEQQDRAKKLLGPISRKRHFGPITSGHDHGEYWIQTGVMSAEARGDVIRAFEGDPDYAFSTFIENRLDDPFKFESEGDPLGDDGIFE